MFCAGSDVVCCWAWSMEVLASIVALISVAILGQFHGGLTDLVSNELNWELPVLQCQVVFVHLVI